MQRSVEYRTKLSLGIFFISIIGMLVISGCFMLIPQPLTVQGEVEATQVRIASKIAGRIKTVHVSEGEQVEAGTLLISLESPELEAKYRQVKAIQKSAGAQRSKAFGGARKEQIATAKNLWLRAKAGTDFALKTYDRTKNLYKEGVVPAQKLDEAEVQYKTALNAEDAAKASYDLALAGAQDEDKESAKALFEQASGAVSEVQSYISETFIAAPIRSEVAEIVLKTGELASPGYPVVTLIDLSDIWITFNLREDLLSGIKMGYLINARVPALDGNTIKLKVNYISSQGDFAAWKATKTSGDFDMKTFEVRAVPVDKIEGLRPGMSVVVDWDDIKKNNKKLN